MRYFFFSYNSNGINSIIITNFMHQFSEEYKTLAVLIMTLFQRIEHRVGTFA